MSTRARAAGTRILVASWLASGISWCGAVAAAQQVIVVDEQLCCGADYQTIREAVENAADGDILLIKDGVYWGPDTVHVNDKSLTFLGDGPDVQVLLQTFEVEQLDASKSVVFRNLTFFGCQLYLTDNDGSVWFEDCEIDAGFDETTGTVAADECARVSFHRCTVVGVSATIFGTPGGEGLWARNSQIAAYDTEFYGGSGNGSHGVYTDAGHAAELDGGFLHASDCGFTGGDTSGFPGGHGLHLVSGAPRAWTLECRFAGGDGRPPGKPVQVRSGSHDELEGAARHVSISTAARVGSSITLEFRGQPFDYVWLPHNFAADFDWQQDHRGVFLLDPVRLLILRVGFLPPSGNKSLTVTTPDIGGLEGLNFFAQGWFFATDGLTLSSGSAATLLDPGF